MKKSRTKWIVLMCSFIIMMLAVCAQAGYESARGIYDDTTIEENVGPDSNCVLFRPTEMVNGNFPIMVFCVGTSGSPTLEATGDRDGYKELIDGFASHGIVIIAGNNKNQNDDYGAQALAALNWLIDQNEQGGIFEGLLNTNKIISMGHSQGGAACINVALQDNRVTSIAALMPGAGTVFSNATEPPAYKEINVPIFYVAAEDDSVILPYLIVLPQYWKTTNAPAWFGIHRDSNHYQVPDTLQTTLRAWLYAQLYNDSSARNVFYGWNWTFKNDSAWKGQRRKNFW